MNEVKRKVVPYEISKTCMKCGTTLTFCYHENAGETLEYIENPGYVHECTKCNKTIVLDKEYPCIEYRYK